MCLHVATDTQRAVLIYSTVIYYITSEYGKCIQKPLYNLYRLIKYDKFLVMQSKYVESGIILI